MAPDPARLRLIDAGEFGRPHNRAQDLWVKAVDGDAFNGRRIGVTKRQGDGRADVNYRRPVPRHIRNVQHHADIAVRQPGFRRCKYL